MALEGTDLIIVVACSIVGGIIIALIIAFIVCTACWGCMIYTTLNKLWDLMGKFADTIDKRRENRRLKKAHKQFDAELARDISEYSEISYDDPETGQS